MQKKAEKNIEIQKIYTKKYYSKILFENIISKNHAKKDRRVYINKQK